MKRVVLAIIGIVVVMGMAVVLTVGLTMYSIFGHNTEMVPGARVGPATLLVDQFVAVYAVPTDSGVLLIDAGTDSTGEALLAGLAEHGWRASDVRGVFLTHGHGDHIAGAALFSAPVYAMADEVDIIEGRAAPDSLVGRLGGPNDGTVQVDVALQDGQQVTVDGVVVTAHQLPGHTPGSAVYVVGDTAFLGDTATAHDDGTMTGAVGIFSEDADRNLQGLRALAGRLSPEVDTLAFGHSGPAPVEQLGHLVRLED